MTLAIIGAGMAGLSCASQLRRAGLNPVVFEKSRGTGGRLATRRSAHGGFDHGAQFVTARDAGFEAYLDHAAGLGRAAHWADPASGDESWWTGTPGMSGLVKPMLEGLDVRTGQRVAQMRREGPGWVLSLETSEEQTFDTVLLAVPVVQALDLLAGHAAAFPGLESVDIAPCWTGMFVFDEALPSTQSVIQRAGDIAWAAREASRPQREGDTERWVVQASAGWSRQHLEETPEAVLPLLLEQFGAAAGATVPEPVHADVHRWRYAKVERPLGQACLWDDALQLGLAGDWCLAARVEAAFLSGRALADAVVTATKR
ncbi:MAG: FAD-dependent oxidoreductase [Maricaulis sp.]|uniref:NAD(P)/FAD-dependent oxidoreductase n=1 Tax=Maricaulis sp. TaxID=1486257 RepID=UPI00262B9411|nr:FAD-dependent oxidoreductase [Maricaulis sp.]MDM7984677.1 FAD-dependent oxidoreductase [Maricaulis sp.]